MNDEAVGKRIKELREQRGMKQAELAERAGISKQLLYSYETGRLKHVPKDTVEKIAEVLGVLPSTLMGWDDAVRNAFMNTYDALDEEDQALAFKFLMTLAANKKYDYTTIKKKG